MPPAKDPDGTGPETLNSFLWWPGLRTWLIIFVDLEECWAQSDLSGTTSPSEHHHLLPRCMKYTILCHRYNFPPWAAIAFAFEVSHSTYKPSRKYDWLIAPWAVYSSLWGCSRRSFPLYKHNQWGCFRWYTISSILCKLCILKCLPCELLWLKPDVCCICFSII